MTDYEFLADVLNDRIKRNVRLRIHVRKRGIDSHFCIGDPMPIVSGEYLLARADAEDAAAARLLAATWQTIATAPNTSPCQLCGSTEKPLMLIQPICTDCY
jgi:hypothetical protein